MRDSGVHALTEMVVEEEAKAGVRLVEGRALSAVAETTSCGGVAEHFHFHAAQAGSPGIA